MFAYQSSAHLALELLKSVQMPVHDTAVDDWRNRENHDRHVLSTSLLFAVINSNFGFGRLIENRSKMT